MVLVLCVTMHALLGAQLGGYSDSHARFPTLRPSLNAKCVFNRRSAQEAASEVSRHWSCQRARGQDPRDPAASEIYSTHYVSLRSQDVQQGVPP